MTGVDTPYESPREPAVRLDTGTESVEANLARLLEQLEQRGWLKRR